jgi:hypothetical protein
MVDVERSKLESGLTLLWLSMVGIAVVALFVCAATLLATAEFLYRHKEKNVRKRPLFWEFWFSLVQPETLVRRTPCPPARHANFSPRLAPRARGPVYRHILARNRTRRRHFGAGFQPLGPILPGFLQGMIVEWSFAMLALKRRQADNKPPARCRDLPSVRLTATVEDIAVQRR